MARWSEVERGSVLLKDKDPKFSEHVARSEGFKLQLNEVCKDRNVPNPDLSTLVPPDQADRMARVRAPYIPHDHMVKLDEDLSDCDGVVMPSVLIEKIIDMAGYITIMDRCNCRENLHCEDYPVDLGCIFVGAAAMEIPLTRGRRATKEEALAHVKKWVDAGLYINAGHVPVDAPAFTEGGDEYKMMSICGCCHCCCSVRFLPGYTKLPGLELIIDHDKCVGCGTCFQNCGFKAIKLVNGKAVSNSDECKICGHCAENCPQKAIEIKLLDPEYINKTMKWISENTDIRAKELWGTPKIA